MAEFIAAESDFALEMSALKVLRTLGFQAEHAAAYVDPVTSRMRAYDIRARLVSESRSLRLAVECKNLRPSAPLLVHTTPRLASEAYHTVVRRYRTGGYLFHEAIRRPNIYEEGRPVGRQTDQPSRENDGGFKSSDAPSYEKWLQALNGCRDLLRELVQAPIPRSQVGVIVPMLVVPDKVLWQVEYDDEGRISEPARMVERTTLILRHQWSAPTIMGDFAYEISHLEIVTLSALRQRVKNLAWPGGLLDGADQLLADRA